MAILNTYMNGYLVGELTKESSGAHSFKYNKSWLQLPFCRPISLSMPLQTKAYKGDVVYNFFDNLLPDNVLVRNKIIARHDAKSSQPFDLLEKIGQDSVGALQLIPNEIEPKNIKTIEYKELNQKQLISILNAYKSNIPLGMIKEEEDFRISIAGAQEKTALLKLDGRWCLPFNSTPTTHIIKLPIGKIEQHSYSIDMSDSVENEFLCMLIAKEFGLPVANCEILKIEDIKVLSVERFDRKFSKDKSWIVRYPQEDFCQVLNVPSAKKYESHGGPGIKDIMDFLLGSDNAQMDRSNFMKSQVLFWLLAASDGHAKNFSVFIKASGAYELTPFYDIMSLDPVISSKGLNIRKVKLSMGLKGKSKKKYNVSKIQPRHFLNTAKHVGFDQNLMINILNDFAQETEKVIENIKVKLPEDFPIEISNSIFNGLKSRAKLLQNLND